MIVSDNQRRENIFLLVKQMREQNARNSTQLLPIYDQIFRDFLLQLELDGINATSFLNLPLNYRVNLIFGAERVNHRR